MSDFKGTPGPWEANYVQSAGWRVRRKFERPGYKGLAPICSMAWYQFDMPGIIDNEISGANAQLIAAAPDLLAALQELADDIADRFDMESRSTNPGMKHAVSIARDAIEKATTTAPTNLEGPQE